MADPKAKKEDKNKKKEAAPKEQVVEEAKEPLVL